MLAHVKNLSLWEIAHHWHGLDPRQSTTHNLPLEVRNTLLVLSKWCGNSVSYRIDKDQAFRFELAQELPRFTARHYRQVFKKAIDTKIFAKRFFSGMFIARSKLARLCLAHNEPLPKFWFPDNERYPFKLEGDISDEVTEDGRFKLVMIYDDTVQLAGASGNGQTIATTVTSSAIKAAQASHAHTNAIKDRFIRFYAEKGTGFLSKKAAAESFFDSLHDKQEKLLFAHREAGIRTLLDALRGHNKGTK